MWRRVPPSGRPPRGDRTPGGGDGSLADRWSGATRPPRPALTGGRGGPGPTAARHGPCAGRHPPSSGCPGPPSIVLTLPGITGLGPKMCHVKHRLECKPSGESLAVRIGHRRSTWNHPVVRLRLAGDRAHVPRETIRPCAVEDVSRPTADGRFDAATFHVKRQPGSSRARRTTGRRCRSTDRGLRSRNDGTWARLRCHSERRRPSSTAPRQRWSIPLVPRETLERYLTLGGLSTHHGGRV